MPHAYRDIAFTDAVRAVQRENRSSAAGDYDLTRGTFDATLGENETIFLGKTQSLYLASVSETGWPYIQHRGGPVGFVKVLAKDLIGWAEFSGNKHYITTGNLVGSDKVSLFVMDYARSLRLKIFGRAEIIAPEDPRMGDLALEGLRTQVERGMLIRLEGFEWNCAKHIPQMFSTDQVAMASQKMLNRIAELEAALEAKG